MKVSFWDILSILGILAIVIFLAFVWMLFQNPYLPVNPFPPLQSPEALVIPTSTSAPQKLPPNWTYTPEPVLPLAATLRPSSSPIPSPTLFIMPTFTPLPPTATLIKPDIPLAGKCKVVSQSPTDGTNEKPGTQFKADWILQNTSDSTWDKSSVDIKYMSGDRMHVTADVLDMPQSVLSNNTFDLGITMQTPATLGQHITYWSLVTGNTTLCSFYIEIVSAN